MEYATLSNGIKMPMLGYGVYQIPEADTERCVLDAISCGYRSIDTAQAYHNEEGVGNAIEKSGVPREELFITTKIWIANAGYEKAKASIAESLRKLKTSYIDLLLIHQPFSDYYGTWRAMEEAYKNGQLRAIGVANFYPDRLIDLCQFAEIAPPCVPAAANRPRHYAEIRRNAPVVGPVCRRAQRLFYQRRFKRNCSKIQ